MLLTIRFAETHVFQGFFSFFTEFGTHWTIAAIAVPLFAATAQKSCPSRYETASTEALQGPGLRRFPFARAQGLCPQPHRACGCGRCPSLHGLEWKRSQEGRQP